MGYFSETDIDMRMPVNDEVEEINFFAMIEGFSKPAKIAENKPIEQKKEEPKPTESEKASLPVIEPKVKPDEMMDTMPETSEQHSTVQSTKAVSEDQKRKEHEEAEAKRKAEWEAKKKAKDDAEKAEWEEAISLDNYALIAASKKRIGDATERLTRRNMKECVTERLQKLFCEDTELAKQAMHPRKNMVNCFRYITRKAKEFVVQEMKDNDIKPTAEGYGSDVPDELCYQWAREYFFDMDAPEDKDENEEKFVPKPYLGKPVSKTNKKAEKKVEKKLEKVAENKPETTKEMPKPKVLEAEGQLDLFSMLGGDFAA